MFDVANLTPDQKALFDQLVAAQRKLLAANDDMVVADAVAGIEEIQELVSQIVISTGAAEEELLYAAEQIAEQDRWNDIVDGTLEGIPGDTVMDEGGTADELRQLMKDSF